MYCIGTWWCELALRHNCKTCETRKACRHSWYYAGELEHEVGTIREKEAKKQRKFSAFLRENLNFRTEVWSESQKHFTDSGNQKYRPKIYHPIFSWRHPDHERTSLRKKRGLFRTEKYSHARNRKEQSAFRPDTYFQFMQRYELLLIYHWYYGCVR